MFLERFGVDESGCSSSSAGRCNGVRVHICTYRRLTLGVVPAGGLLARHVMKYLKSAYSWWREANISGESSWGANAPTSVK